MKNFLVAALMLLSLTSFAQSKFIEVEVTDTITLKPASFRYNIYFRDADAAMFAMDEEGSEEDLQEKERFENQKEEIKRFLINAKYPFTEIEDSNVEINTMSLIRMGGSGNGFSITVASIEDVRNIRKALGKMKNITASVKVLKYLDEKKAEEQLMKRLIENAKSKATFIGLSSGLKVGKIIEVKEGDGNSFIGEMKELFEEASKFAKSEDNPGYYGSLSKTFIVKFAAD